MYIFLQQYWWLVVSLLGAILVFLLFVQGGNSLLFCLGKTEEHRKMMVNSTGRKWEFTFTTLVTFGGAFFASFPLFYSTTPIRNKASTTGISIKLVRYLYGCI
jgi:cytochrome bd ubiquinol oxidase subunit II